MAVEATRIIITVTQLAELSGELAKMADEPSLSLVSDESGID